MNVMTRVQLEDYTIRSYLAADLIHRLATPILKTGLLANTRNMYKGSVYGHTNLSAWLWHLEERFSFVRYLFARGTANSVAKLRLNSLKSSITQTEQSNVVSYQATLLSVTIENLMSYWQTRSHQSSLDQDCLVSKIEVQKVEVHLRDLCYPQKTN
ncbi:MAG: hypothetical protein EZS28_041268 [Streblomastix strix]|uniref:Uncharacterized protein n=1 Tax=Streblomastix strix TaxID=222440 RepID=A0A5J4U0I4_9EUKA|nr:MAG: hypothetical protein EZS28_041268 [Streblomastix strix]